MRWCSGEAAEQMTPHGRVEYLERHTEITNRGQETRNTNTGGNERGDPGGKVAACCTQRRRKTGGEEGPLVPREGGVGEGTGLCADVLCRKRKTTCFDLRGW